MKTAKNLLFSVLLFAFGFLVVHDYVIADVDADTQYELCYAQGNDAALDLPSQIHEHIHILLSVPECCEALPSGPLAFAPEAEVPHTPPSHITTVRPRPPLS